MPSLLLCLVNHCSYFNYLLAFVLVMLCQKHVNMLPTRLKLMSAWRKLAWKMPKLHFKKQSFKPRTLGRAKLSGRRLAMRLAWSTRNWKPLWKLISFQRSFCSKKPWNMLMQSTSFTHGKVHHYKLKFPMVLHGQLSEW